MNNATIIIGLGNPGAKFQDTRHNVGFMAVDKFAEINNFPEFKLNKKFNAEISSAFVPLSGTSADKEGNFGEQEVLLVKPQTFMNNSGKAVRSLTKPYTLHPKPLLIIVHDDIDLPVGKIKIVQERGSAGHKGVESIIKSIGNENLIRIRVGIKGKKDVEAGDVVLKKFSPDEQNLINEAINNACEAISVIIEENLNKAMNEYN